MLWNLAKSLGMCVHFGGMKHAQSSELTENVSRVIKILLARDGLSQTDLAEILDYNASTITRGLNGERKWSADDIQHLAEAFEVDPGLFFQAPGTLVRSKWFSRELVSA